MTPALSVIIPAYNEAERIGLTLHECVNALEHTDHEIIVVDDGSPDATYREACKAASKNSRIKVIRCGQNGGKGAALRTGFPYASGERVVFLDADLDIHPRQIPLFLDYMKRFNADIVVGSKRHPLSKLRYPLHRRLLSTCYFLWIKLLFGLRVKDTQTGLKLFKRDVLQELFPRILVKKYAFSLELLANAHRNGFKTVEAPIEIDFQRHSKLKMKDIVGMFRDTAAIFYRMWMLRYYDVRPFERPEIPFVSVVAEPFRDAMKFSGRFVIRFVWLVALAIVSLFRH